jgi:hypothetical protein
MLKTVYLNGEKKKYLRMEKKYGKIIDMFKIGMRGRKSGL